MILEGFDLTLSSPDASHYMVLGIASGWLYIPVKRIISSSLTPVRFTPVAKLIRVTDDSCLIFNNKTDSISFYAELTMNGYMSVVDTYEDVGEVISCELYPENDSLRIHYLLKNVPFIAYLLPQN